MHLNLYPNPNQESERAADRSPGEGGEVGAANQTDEAGEGVTEGGVLTLPQAPPVLPGAPCRRWLET